MPQAGLNMTPVELPREELERMIFFEEACQRAESDHDKDPTDAQVGSRPFIDTFPGKHKFSFSGSHALGRGTARARSLQEWLGCRGDDRARRKEV